MMTSLAHVHEDCRPLFDTSNEERKAFILSDNFISYPVAKTVLSKVARMVTYPRLSRPLCLLLVGEPGYGKSSILDRIEIEHDGTDVGALKRRVLRINLPGQMDLPSFFSRLLLALDVPFRPTDRASVLLNTTITAIAESELRVLLIDELHNIFLGSKSAIPIIMAMLRDLTNTLKISLVCAGTSMAETCIVVDGQLHERFDRHLLRPWIEDQVLRNFLGNLERRLPLHHPSNLSGLPLMPLLLRMSDGRMNRLILLIREAAALSIDTSVECINEPMLRTVLAEQAAARPDWTLDGSRAMPL